jgi:hypothetical protein
MTSDGIAYVYVGDSPHPAGTAERQPDGRWRASTRHKLIGHFPDRDSAVEAVHEALGDGASS